jgi:histidine triad (HIT) family protein
MIMHLHEPIGYHCPICAIMAAAEDPRVIVWRDQYAVAIVARVHHQKNPGALLLCSLEHFENIFVLPDHIGAHLFGVSKRLAFALKSALSCDGVSTRQHNEPAGSQEVWHYHQHIVPRYHGDNFYAERGSLMPIELRVDYAEKLKAALSRPD